MYLRMDGVVPYRLEMQAKAAIGTAKDMYAYWEVVINIFANSNKFYLNE